MSNRRRHRLMNLPDDLVPFYDDGPDWPTTDERQQAERAYRDAFLLSAREAAHWTSIDKDAIDRAWEERRHVRQQAEVLIPSAIYFDEPHLESDQIVYRREHLIDASRTRGRVHGFEFVRQCWEALLDGGVDEHAIARQIIRPWLESVAEWVATEITPDRFDTPRLPDEDLSQRQRRMLQQAMQVIAASDPKHPEAILNQLNQITREQLEWLWPGRIPLGKLTLLAGDPGLGKSFVTLDLAARVSRGESWPDLPLFKQRPGKAIIMNCEDDSADTIAPRLDKAGADGANVYLLEGVRTGDQRRMFSLEFDLPLLEQSLQQIGEARLIVIDPISAYCGKIDSHKNSDVRGMLAPLAELAARYRVAILCITHLSKSGGAKAVYRAMGSLAFAAAARAVWAISKDADEPERRLFLPAKLNLAKDPDGLAYRIVDGRVAWEELPVTMHADDAIAAELQHQTSNNHRGQERREAVAWLRSELASAPIPSTQIIADAKEQGFSERTLRRAFGELGGRSKKGSDGVWQWSLPNQLGQQDGQQDCQEAP
ncbi:MAG TPA: AAA family ATPase [Pirellulaceae bacterium]|nr:AAA family ATPase [Pirellulaceae bacterium]